MIRENTTLASEAAVTPREAAQGHELALVTKNNLALLFDWKGALKEYKTDLIKVAPGVSEKDKAAFAAIEKKYLPWLDVYAAKNEMLHNHTHPWGALMLMSINNLFEKLHTLEKALQVFSDEGTRRNYSEKVGIDLPPGNIIRKDARLLTLIKNRIPVQTNSGKTDLHYYLAKAIINNSKGYIVFSKVDRSIDNGKDGPVYTINKSAAEKNVGYGPLMYNIAMSLIWPRGWLCSDRDSVSKKAASVWEYMLNNRPDVQKKLMTVSTDNFGLPGGSPHQSAIWTLSSQIDNLKDDLVDLDLSPVQKQKIQAQLAAKKVKLNAYMKENPSAWKYKIKKPVGTKLLAQNTDTFLKILGTKEYGNIKGLSKDLLMSVGEEYFHKRY